jgi:hypothetical protein
VKRLLHLGCKYLAGFTIRIRKNGASVSFSSLINVFVGGRFVLQLPQSVVIPRLEEGLHGELM